MRNTFADMAAHLRPPEPRRAQRFGALVVAIVLAAAVLIGFRGEPRDEATTTLVQSASNVTTAPTVLGEVIERTTTLPLASPASAVGVTTTSTEAPATTAFTPAPTNPPPALGPPVSITRPPDRTTTTTAPTTTSSTTTTTERTTTTTDGSTTTSIEL